MVNIKTASESFKSHISGTILAIKSNKVTGSFINNKEVETRTDYIFYANGKVLSKSYRNNRLCTVSLSKAQDLVF
jgi:hypothetical protein